MLETIQVTAEEYARLIPDRRVFFNEPRFTELNSDKADEVLYLVVQKGSSPRFGAIVGRRGDEGRMPFSAPYAYPVSVDPQARVESFDEALQSLEVFCFKRGMTTLRFVFPPFFYDEHTLSAWVSAMYRAGWRVQNLDINYSLNLLELGTEAYPQLLSKKVRSHLKKAMTSGIEIVRCENEEDYRESYGIILENHTAKSRPMHMSFEQVMDTFALVRHEAFVARLDGKPIASMIYYEVTSEIVQCIYSGYLLEYSNSGVMNYLTWHAIRFFSEKGYRLIDRAISTEDSVPNYGLCDFKESVGAKRSLKYSFIKALSEPSAGGGKS